MAATLAALASAAALLGPPLPARADSTPVAHYVFTPSPIAPVNSLAVGQSVPLLVTAEDGGGSPVPGAVVYLRFDRAPGGGSLTGPGGVHITATPRPFSADGAGQVSLAYTAPGDFLHQGRDLVTAQNSATAPTLRAMDVYYFQSIHSFAFAPYPIAQPGTLSGGGTVQFTVTALLENHPGGGATIWLSLAGARLGRMYAGGVQLTKTPQPFLADANGAVQLTYVASTAHALPLTGTDIVFARSTAAGPVLGADAYSYGSAARYAFSPTPIAPPGSLPPLPGVALKLHVVDRFGGAVAGAKVYLSFSSTSSPPGSAVVFGAGAPGLGPVDDLGLTEVPLGVRTDVRGNIVIEYFPPFPVGPPFPPPPPHGTDTVLAQNALHDPTITAADRYTY